MAQVAPKPFSYRASKESIHIMQPSSFRQPPSSHSKHEQGYEFPMTAHGNVLSHVNGQQQVPPSFASGSAVDKTPEYSIQAPEYSFQAPEYSTQAPEYSTQAPEYAMGSQAASVSVIVTASHLAL